MHEPQSQIDEVEEPGSWLGKGKVNASLMQSQASDDLSRCVMD